MANYVLAFRGGGMPATEEEQQQAMAAWGAWFGGLGSAVVDAGNPFGDSRSLGSDGSESNAAAGRPPRGPARSRPQTRRGQPAGACAQCSSRKTTVAAESAMSCTLIHSRREWYSLPPV
jgi:hypothetical protein